MTQRNRSRNGDATAAAGIYCRLSLARLGDTTKVDDQERICRELAGLRGWEVFRVYTDNSKSAWQRDRKRPEWEAMLADVEAGHLTAIIVYHGDRLIRQPWDLELLLRLADTRGIRLASPTGTRDLSNPDDRFILRIEAAQACRESDNISRRKKAGFRRMARAGIAPSAGGRWGRGFGYDSSGRTPVPEEAAALREAATRALAGEPLTVIAASLSGRGLRSTSGAPLTYKLLKELLLRPRVAGLLADGEPGNWEPILTPETQRMVAEVLGARSARYRSSNAPVYLLSGIARCGVCGSGLQRKSSGREGSVSLNYGCVAPGCRRVMRNMAHLDLYVSERVLLKLADPANPPAQVPESPALSEEMASLAAQRAETEAAVADHAGGHLDLLMRRLDSIDARLAELRSLAAGDAHARLLHAHQGMTRAQWEAEPLAVRRALVAACFTVTVQPASKRGPGFRTEDVQLEPPHDDRL